MTSLRRTCHAKLNLALAVTGRRADGYHTLRSVFLALQLHDELEAELARAHSSVDELVVDGDADTPVATNLVLRAAALLRETARQSLPALRFRLTKRIPVAAGLGGGSSDAAAALDLAAELWGLELEPRDRLVMALQLGADVPFFAAGHTVALVDGIGEGLEPLPAPTSPAGVLLVTPAARLSTAAVFAEFDRDPPQPLAGAGPVDRLRLAFRGGLDGSGIAKALAQPPEANDLWAAARRLAPELPSLRDRLSRFLARPVLLTGSGPTLFAVYPSGAAAAAAAAALTADRAGQLAGATIIATTSHQGEQP